MNRINKTTCLLAILFVTPLYILRGQERQSDFLQVVHHAQIGPGESDIKRKKIEAFKAIKCIYIDFGHPSPKSLEEVSLRALSTTLKIELQRLGYEIAREPNASSVIWEHSFVEAHSPTAVSTWYSGVIKSKDNQTIWACTIPIVAPIKLGEVEFPVAERAAVVFHLEMLRQTKTISK